MLDIWGFLLQTLTASGVAVLLLVIKALFRDKLPPKWHFAVWGVLGIMMLLPAGMNGHYTLFPWRLVVETIKSWCGEYRFIQVLFPIPVLTFVPKTLFQWLFTLYIIGVVAYAVKYLISYIRLRLLLGKGSAPSAEVTAAIEQIAAEQKVRPCKVIRVSGLSGAFVCGVMRPVLVIPTEEIDKKIILHELLHLKYKDTFWSIVICLLRCIHWCNPLIAYCADRAINDMEARCDQHVLEQLAGEERRDYGRILLSMANDRFAKTPGSTCINNGGKNIRRRIEAIARFKLYPAGMELVSLCAILVLTVSLAVGVQAEQVYDSTDRGVSYALASARSTPCTTPAGAFDTYAKAILEQNGIYRAMCAPEAMQAELQNELLERDRAGIYPNWDCGLDAWPNTQGGYYIYNLRKVGKIYEGLLVVQLNYPPDGQPGEEGKIYLAVQNLRVEKEKGRWVAIPLDDFQNVEASDQKLTWGCMELPGIVYSGIYSDIRIDAKVQTVYTVESNVQNDNGNLFFGNNTFYDTTPLPNAVFTRAARTNSERLTHAGSAQDRDKIALIGLSLAPVYPGENPPDSLPAATGYNSAGSSNTGESWSSQKTDPGWGPTIEFSGGGSTFDPEGDVALPRYYVAELYINNELTARLDLHLQEEVEE